MSTRLLEEKSIIITGASTGMGHTSALVFAAYGAKLVLADVNEKDGEATASRIRESGGDAIFVRTDVTCAAEVEALVARAVERHGRLDGAFNNAGIDGSLVPTAECTEENWSRTIAVNLTGVFLCMKYEIIQMLKQGGGTIANTASVAGVVGLASTPAYAAAKHGVIGLTKCAALEYGKLGIRVNALCPGGIRTPMLESAFKQGFMNESALTGLHPIGRLGTTEEIAETAAFLCSDRSSFITGQALSVDGGWTAQ